MFYQKMIVAKSRIDAEIEGIQCKIQKLPENNFYCIRENGHWKWYYVVDKRLHYISKENYILAKQLACYKYYKRRLRDLRRELAPIDAYLKKYRIDKDSASKLLREQSGYTQLLDNAILPADVTAKLWMEESFQQNPLHPENKLHKVNDNLSVRSKSEALIASQLQYYQIPFRYECALQLQSGIVYPDFTICHPKTGEIYYWEHLGLLDQPIYKTHAAAKVKGYIESDIMPEENLILTFESQGSPLSIACVSNRIEKYLI